MIQNWNELENPNQNRKLKKNIFIIKIYPIKWITPLTRKDTNNLPPWGKELNIIKKNESLEWFRTETSSRIRIEIEKWRKTSASLRCIQLSELHH